MTEVLELADVASRRDGKKMIDGISLTVNAASAQPVVGYGDGRWTALAKVSGLVTRIIDV